MKNKFKNIMNFLGPKVFLYFTCGLFVGIFLFVVELAFAFSLQSFLVALGVLSLSNVSIPVRFQFFDLRSALLLVFGIGTARALFLWAQAHLSTLAAETQRKHQRSLVVGWALRSYSASSSDVMVMYNEQTGSVSAVMGSMSTIITLITTGVLSWIQLCRFALAPTLLATLIMAMAGIAVGVLDRQVRAFGNKLHIVSVALNEGILRNIRNLLLVQIYGTQEKELKVLNFHLSKYRDYIMSFTTVSGLKNFVPQVLGVSVLCFLTLYIKQHDLLAPSMIISYFYLFVRFVQNLTETFRNFTNIRFQWPQFQKLYMRWLERAAPDLQKLKTIEKQSLNLGPPFTAPIGWDLRNVSYSYEGGTAEVLSNLNLHIEPGKLTVITGSSGSGKSTLLHILLGLYPPTCGTIEMLENGKHVNLSDNVPRLLKSVGYVSPENFIIEGTIFENLCYGLDSDPSLTDVENALNLAEADFVFNMPKKLAHHLTEQGQGLSAGQKQRLSLARALLRNPKVLILDEATSNLDYETEARLIKTFVSLKQKMTLVLVTHRPAALAFADMHLKLSEKL